MELCDVNRAYVRHVVANEEEKHFGPLCKEDTHEQATGKPGGRRLTNYDVDADQ